MSAAQDEIAAIRAAIAAVDDELVELRAHLAATEAARRAAAARDDDAAVAVAAAALAALDDRQRGSHHHRQNQIQKVTNSRARLMAATADPFTLLDGQIPLLMLPVRLETRFAWLDPGDPTRHRFDAAGATTPVLLVRIYPDDIHVDGHDPHLTMEESEWQRAWLKRVDAGRGLAHFVDAWAELIARVGHRRAAWIAHASRVSRRPLAADRLGRPARAALMPDLWLAVARTATGQRTAASKLVAEDLAVTPDPTALGKVGPGTPAGEALAWLTDFDVALEAGMALRIPFAPGATPLVERLVVVGACGSFDAERAGAAFAALLDAHHYTDGLAFLAPNAPTNATPDQHSAMTRVRSAREVFDVEGDMFPLVSPPRTLADHPASDGAISARLLGIDPATFAHVARADILTTLASRDLRVIIAHATLPHLRRLTGTNFSEEDWQLAEFFFTDGPGALGPAPILRIGNQPYGILPVSVRTPRDVDLAPDAPLGRLVGLLDLLRSQIWDSAEKRVPRIGAARFDPAAPLLDILCTDGAARSLHARPALAPGLASALPFSQEILRSLAVARQQLDDLLGRLGSVDPHPPLVDLVHLARGAPIRAPLVQAKDAVGVDRFQDYMRILALSDLLGFCNLHDLATGNYAAVGGRPGTFLFALARAALLTSADTAARDMLRGSIDPAWTVAWDADTSDGVLGFETPLYPLADRLMARWPDPAGAGIHVWLTSGTPPNEASPFLTVRAAVRSLAVPSPVPGAVRTHDPDFIDTVLRAEVGLLTHRLDAWYALVATNRIQAARSAHPNGLALGAFGVLEHIAPTTQRTLASTTGLPSGFSGPVFTDPANAGFVHAPSATHAAAAAVLRSAHLAHHSLARDAGQREAFAVELSSRRVRTAIEILEGLREGQPLGALLGYRIERSLLASTPEAIAIARRAAPLVANKLHPSNRPAEEVAANNVVDGLALLTAAGYGTNSDIDEPTLRAALDLSALSTARANAVVAALAAALREALEACDAYADLSVAEGVHQLVQGNPTRTGGAVDAVAGTETLLLDPAVTATPQSGAGVVHRLLIALDGTAVPSPDDPEGWAASPRARLAPVLEGWARAFLPAPEAVGVRLEITDAAGAATVMTTTLGKLHAAAVGAGFDDARLGALDLLAANPPWSEAARGGTGQVPIVSEVSPLGVRLDFCARQHVAANNPAAVRVRLVAGRDPAWTAATVGITEMLHVAEAIRVVVINSRPLLPADFAPPGARPSATLELSGLRGRVDAAAGLIGALAATLITLADAADAHRTDPSAAARLASAASDRARLTAALFDADAYGVVGALPAAVNDMTGNTETAAVALASTARRAATELTARLDALAAAAPPPSADPAARLQAERSRAEALFGRGAMVTADILAIDRDPFRQCPAGATDDAVRLHCARAARVRPGAARFDHLVSLAEALHGRSPAMAVAQVPAGSAAGDGAAGGIDPSRWVALCAAAGKRVPAGRASIVAHLPAPLTAPTRLCGLAVDEWVEVVPSTHETTSVAFNYDAPSSAPPNVMLLTANPPGRETWTANDAIHAVDEALAIARLRAVDPHALAGSAPPILGLVTQENTAGDVAALDIAALTAPPPTT